MSSFWLLVGVFDKLLDKMPSFDQTKKNKFYKLKKELIHEENKPFISRDDNRIDNLRDELQLLIQVFDEEISKKKL